MHDALDRRFKDACVENINWNYCCDPQHYAYLRVTPQQVFPSSVCRASYMDAPSCQAFFHDRGFPGISCSHTFGLRVRFVTAGPDGICRLSPDHVSGLSMSHEALRLIQPRFYLFRHHRETACAIVDESVAKVRELISIYDARCSGGRAYAGW